MKTIITTLNSKYIHSSLALRSLKAYCREDYPDIVMMEFSINDNIDRIISRIAREHPDLLCFSCYIWNIEETTAIIGTIKKILPQCRILLGGPEVSYDGFDFMRSNPYIDYIIAGEGEEAFYRLLDCLHKDGDMAEVKGLLRRKGEEILFNDPQESLSLDAIPFVYEDGFGSLQNKIIYYETSRGCPYKCQYCLSSTTGGVKFLSINRVKKDIASFIEAGVKQVKLVDRTFNCNPARAREIFSYIIDMKGHTNFHFEMAGDIIDQETLELLKSAPTGLFQFEIGVQSTKELTLESIKRKNDLVKIKNNVLKLIDADNIHIHLDLIAGLPEEDKASMANSINDVLGIRPHRLQLGFLKMLKGSGLRNAADDYDYRYTSYPPYEVLSNSVLSYEELLQLKEIEELLELYYNSHRFDKAINYLVMQYNDDAFKMFDDMADHWRKKGYFNYSHSNVRLYEIILSFGQSLTNINRELFKELLLFDYVSHEKPLRYPEGLEPKKNELYIDRIHQFLRENDNLERLVPRLKGYSAKQALRIIHIEVFNYKLDDIGEEAYSSGETSILFDYGVKLGALEKTKITRLNL